MAPTILRVAFAQVRRPFGSPGRSRTYVASPDSKSGGPCRQTNRGKSRKVTLSVVCRQCPPRGWACLWPADQPGKVSKGHLICGLPSARRGGNAACLAIKV